MPNEHDLDMFRQAQALNPKPFKRGIGYAPDPVSVKCATIDCCFKADTGTIFCVFCDNEHLTQMASSDSPSEELFRRRKALADKRKGIDKAPCL